MVRKSIVTRSSAVWAFVSLTTILLGVLGVRDHSVNAADTGYRLVANFAQVPPGETFGGVGGVAFDAKGVMYVFRRTNDMWTFDPSGKFLKVWGKALAKTSHSVRVDRNGFIWTTDSGGHQVKKYRADGTLVMTLGKYNVAGDGPDTFNGPTDLVVAPNGDIFVADGHCLPVCDPKVLSNHRVVKFNKDGTFIKAWGTKGTGPGQFDVPHSIIQDSRGRILVADGTNKRIQIFDTEGTFLDQWTTNVGDPYGLDITKDDVLYVADHGTFGSGEGGHVVILDARHGGKLLGSIGVPAANALALDRAGNIYVAATQEHYWASPDSPKTMCCLAKFVKTP